MQSILSFVARIALACAFMGVVGCATKGSISIKTTPSRAKIEIRRMDGIIVKRGLAPMTAYLEHGKDYTVTISLAGYQTQTISVKSITDHPDLDESCLYCSIDLLLIFFQGVDPGFTDSDSEDKFEPSTINVQLKEVTAQNGSDTAIYALLTIVYEDGKHQHATVEMTPVAAD